MNIGLAKIKVLEFGFGFPPKLFSIWSSRKKIYFNKDNFDLKSDQIISKTTSENLRLILEKVVSKGTARETDFGGYLVGGKTGTAEKPNPIKGGYYENKVISTFASAFPISTGDFVLVVTLDEPENNFGSESYRYASKTAVPVAAKIISRVKTALKVFVLIFLFNKSKFLIPENSILIMCKPIVPNIRGNKKLIKFGKNDVILVLKKEFKVTSKIAIEIKKIPAYK